MKSPFENKLLNQIGQKLLFRKETVAVAESVSSGLIQNAFSQMTNATQFFQGGLTVYNLGQKSRFLWVDPIHAPACNCVSQAISEQMARGISKRFSSHWGIASTGYASPVPELDIDSLFAHYAISHSGVVVTSGKIDAPKKMDPYAAQLYYANEILTVFFKTLFVNG